MRYQQDLQGALGERYRRLLDDAPMVVKAFFGREFGWI
jgi:hypothetical protein